MKVTSQKLIQHVIMKENPHRLMLDYSSPPSQPNTVNTLENSGEEQLIRNTLWSKANIEPSD